MNEHTCPICGYSDLQFVLEFGEICSCCGNEFGYNDFDRTYEELREEWVQGGMKWWSSYCPTPANWWPAHQLAILKELPTVYMPWYRQGAGK